MPVVSRLSTTHSSDKDYILERLPWAIDGLREPVDRDLVAHGLKLVMWHDENLRTSRRLLFRVRFRFSMTQKLWQVLHKLALKYDMQMAALSSPKAPCGPITDTWKVSVATASANRRSLRVWWESDAIWIRLLHATT